MAISDIIKATQASQAATNGGATAKNAVSTLNENFDMFLQLLTAQLQHQDPTEPLKANEFVNQLSQFSGIEQQIKLVQTAQAQLELQKNAQNRHALNLVGQMVQYQGDSSAMVNGTAHWNLTSSGSTEANVTVHDESGNALYQTRVHLRSGENRFEWNGKADNGSAFDRGTFKISVQPIKADGSPGDATISTTASGRVERAQMDGNITVNGQTMHLDNVLSVQALAPQTGTPNSQATQAYQRLLPS